MTFTFTAAVAWDSIGKQAVKNTSFQVYTQADTGFVTPLAITDTFGVALPGNILNSGTIGVFPEFKQAANSTVVITDPTRTYVWTVASVMQDTSVSAFVNNKTSSTAGAVRAATASIWQTSTAYTAGQPVINPTGDLMRCTTAHTSTTTYDSTKFALNATDASSATSAALSVTYALNAAGRIGPRWLFLGDSITAGSVTTDNAYWAQAFAVQAALQSKGQIIHARNAGIPGNTTAQMDARFATDVTPYASQIDAVFLLAGTNDSAVTALAPWIASMKSIIGKIRAIGKQPIMATIPPNNGAAPRPAAITQQNAWIRRYAGMNGIPLVDFYKVLVDGTTGSYLTGHADDGTHPNATGRIAMANTLVTTLQPLLSPSPVIIPQDNNDPNNLLTNGCFVNWTTPLAPPTITIGTVATGGTLAAGTYFYKATVLNYQGESLPTNEVSVTITAGQQPQLTIPNNGGQRVLNIYRSTTTNTEVLLAPNVAPGAYPASAVWNDSGALTPGTTPVPTTDYTTNPTGWAGITGGPQKTSKVTDSLFQGNVTRLLATGSTQGQTQNVAMAGKFSAGDTLALVGVTKSNTQAPNLQFRFNGGAAPNAFTAIADGAAAGVQGVYYKEMTVPSGTTSLDVFIQNDAGATGSCDFGQVGVYNLTTLGII